MSQLSLVAPDYTTGRSRLALQLGALASTPIILLYAVRRGTPRGRELAITAAVAIAVMLWFAVTARGLQRRRLTLVAAAPSAGVRPYVGQLFSGLPSVPPEAFPTLDASYWSVVYAFDTRDVGVRLFEALDTQRESAIDQTMIGALLHVPRAAFPAFRLATRMSASSGAPNLPDWLSANYSILTDDPARITRVMRAEAMHALQQLEGWSMEGRGDWVLVWRRETLTPTNLRPIAEHALRLARALRD